MRKETRELVAGGVWFLGIVLLLVSIIRVSLLLVFWREGETVRSLIPISKSTALALMLAIGFFFLVLGVARLIAFWHKRRGQARADGLGYQIARQMSKIKVPACYWFLLNCLGFTYACWIFLPACFWAG